MSDTTTAKAGVWTPCPDCNGTGADPNHTWGTGDLPKPGMEVVHASCERCEGCGELPPEPPAEVPEGGYTCGWGDCERAADLDPVTGGWYCRAHPAAFRRSHDTVAAIRQHLWDAGLAIQRAQSVADTQLPAHDRLRDAVSDMYRGHERATRRARERTPELDGQYAIAYHAEVNRAQHGDHWEIK